MPTPRLLSRSVSSAFLAFSLIVPLGAMQAGRDVGCSEWRECRQLALAAADRHDYERFHDLAWRTVQLGPARDSTLMVLLARAQALSGRPHDALVMLDRLAGMGVAVDAEADDEFALTRQLPGWPEVLAHIDRVRHPEQAEPAAPGITVPRGAASAAPRVATAKAATAKATTARDATGKASAAPAAASAAVPPTTDASVPRQGPLEALRFSTGAFTPAGLAYDAVSQRFLFGDRAARKLFVVSERSQHANDFARAESAGFQEIAAIEIDAKRGDLWVVSVAPADGTGTLHKLQLVSGRLLRSFPIAAGGAPVSTVDLAVTPAGAVLVLDAAGKQLIGLRPKGAMLEPLVRFEAPEVASVTATDDEGIAYVSHRDGVARVDLRARTAAPLAAGGGVALDRLERIRWRSHALIGVRIDEDGTRRITRLDLNASGRAVAREKTLERLASAAGPTFVTFSGDELVYLADGAAVGGNAPADATRPVEFVAYRVKIR